MQCNLLPPGLVPSRHRIEVRGSSVQPLADGFDKDGQLDIHGPGQVLGDWMDLTVG